MREPYPNTQKGGFSIDGEVCESSFSGIGVVALCNVTVMLHCQSERRAIYRSSISWIPRITAFTNDKSQIILRVAA